MVASSTAAVVKCGKCCRRPVRYVAFGGAACCGCPPTSPCVRPPAGLGPHPQACCSRQPARIKATQAPVEATPKQWQWAAVAAVAAAAPVAQGCDPLHQTAPAGLIVQGMPSGEAQGRSRAVWPTSIAAPVACCGSSTSIAAAADPRITRRRLQPAQGPWQRERKSEQCPAAPGALLSGPARAAAIKQRRSAIADQLPPACMPPCAKKVVARLVAPPRSYRPHLRE